MRTSWEWKEKRHRSSLHNLRPESDCQCWHTILLSQDVAAGARGTSFLGVSGSEGTTGAGGAGEDIIGPSQRSNLDVAAVFPEAQGRRFGALVEAADPDAALVVERATCWNAGGRFWSAGAAAAGVPLR